MLPVHSRGANLVISSQLDQNKNESCEKQETARESTENETASSILNSILEYGNDIGDDDESTDNDSNECYEIELAEETILTSSPTHFETREAEDSSSKTNETIDSEIDDQTYELNDSDNSFDSDKDVVEEHQTTENDKSNEDLPEPKTKRARKGQAKPIGWTRNYNKLLRMRGEAYVGVRCAGENQKYIQDVNRAARDLGPTCSSEYCKKAKTRHCNEFTEKERATIHGDFWKTMDWQQRKVYIATLIDQVQPKSRTTNEVSKRGVTLIYNLKKGYEKRQVCNKMFLSTLSLKETQVKYWVREGNSGMHSSKDYQQMPTRKQEKHSKRREHVQDFLEKLPKLPSHYCRQSSTRLYLHPPLKTFSDVYNLYLQEATSENKEIACRKVFKQEYDRLNLSTFHPKKDQCDICCANEAGNVSKEEYEEHMQRKTAAREEKCRDKEKATQSDGKVIAVTVDVQAVLIVPYLKASALYYKQKLACHNFTVYDLVKKNALCYFWDETEGDMTANIFASCIVDYLASNRIPGLTTYIIFSDGCAAQNRNIILANALLHFAVTKSITIEHKYLEKGHTQMEGDNVHSVVECARKDRNVYVPAQYVEMIQTARKTGTPYGVKYLEHDFFSDFSAIKYYRTLRPGKKKGDPCVHDICCLRYNPTGKIEFKLKYTDEWKELPQRLKSGFTDSAIVPLYKGRLPITSQKFADLQSVKHVLHKNYHSFYDQLPH